MRVRSMWSLQWPLLKILLWRHLLMRWRFLPTLFIEVGLPLLAAGLICQVQLSQLPFEKVLSQESHFLDFLVDCTFLPDFSLIDPILKQQEGYDPDWFHKEIKTMAAASETPSDLSEQSKEMDDMELVYKICEKNVRDWEEPEGRWKFVYTPRNNSYNKEVLSLVVRMLKMKDEDLIGVDTEEDIIKLARNAYLNNDTYFLGGVIFHSKMDPKNVVSYYKYTLRVRNQLVKSNQRYLPWLPPFEFSAKSGMVLFKSKYLQLKYLIDTGIMQTLCKGNCDKNLNIQKSKVHFRMMPLPEMKMRVRRNNSNHIIYLRIFFVFLLLIHWPIIAYILLLEQQKCVDIQVACLGVSNVLKYFTWTLCALVPQVPVLLAVSLILTWDFSGGNGSALEKVSPSILFTLLMLYAVASMTLVFMIITICTNAFYSLNATAFLWLGTAFAAIMQITPQYNSMSFFPNYLFVVHPNGALILGICICIVFYVDGVELNWSSLMSYPLFTTENIDNQSTMKTLYMVHIFLFFVLEIVAYTAVIYLFLLYGTEKWMRIAKFFGVRKKSVDMLKEHEIFLRFPRLRKRISEPVDSHLNPVMIINNLRKSFPSRSVLNGVSMTVYAGEILAFLGPTCSGKTTLLRILAGIESATSGSFEILNEKKSLGYCAHPFAYLDNLTMRENLIFFGMLRGFTYFEAEREAHLMEERLSLHTVPSELWMNRLPSIVQRKLAICNAFIGNPSIVLLDQPTIGLDSKSKIPIWETLELLRQDNTIVMTTEDVKEANLLASRTALLLQGKVVCDGKANFICQQLGAGYQLSVVKLPGCTRAHRQALSNLVKSIIPKGHRLVYDKDLDDPLIELKKTEKLSKIIFYFPNEEKPKFPILFNNLKSQCNELKIKNCFELRFVTLDNIFEAFENLCVDPVLPKEMKAPLRLCCDAKWKKLSEEDCVLPVTGIVLFMQRIRALVYKCFIWTCRRRSFFLMIAIFLFLMAIFSKYNVNNLHETHYDPVLPSLTLKLRLFRAPQFVYRFADAKSREMKRYFLKQLGFWARKQEIVGNSTEFFLTMAKDNILRYILKYMGGIVMWSEKSEDSSTSTIHARVWHNLYVPHSSNILLSILSNIRFSYFFGSEKSIDTVAHSIPNFQRENVEFLDAVTYPKLSKMGLWAGMLLSVGVVMLCISLVTRTIMERLSQCKKLQLMTGLSPAIYWACTLLWDLFLYLILLTVMILTFWLLDDTGLMSDTDAVWSLAEFLLAYGASGLLFSYILSYTASSLATGLQFLVLVHVLTGILMPPLVHILQDRRQTSVFGLVLHWPFQLFFPSYLLSLGLIRFFLLLGHNHRCRFINQDLQESICRWFFDVKEYQNSPWMQQTNYKCCDRGSALTSGEWAPSGSGYRSWYIHLWDMHRLSSWQVKHIRDNEALASAYRMDLRELYGQVQGVQEAWWLLSAQAFFFFFLLVLMDSGYLKKIKRLLTGSGEFDSMAMCKVDFHTTVVDEHAYIYNLIQTGNFSAHMLVVFDLSQMSDYVEGVSFKINYGECFGVYGENEPGKSNIVNMLTSHRPDVSGDAYLNGNSLVVSSYKYLRCVGFSPEEFGLMEDMSGREMMNMMGWLRGMPKWKMEKEMRMWGDALGVSSCLSRPSKLYGIAVKRMVSVMVALLGGTNLIVLKDPSKNLRVLAKRRLWAVIRHAKNQQRSFLITTSSVEECDMVCDHVGVTSGRMLMSIELPCELESYASRGYILVVRFVSGGLLAEPSLLKAVKSKLERHLSPCEALVLHRTMLVYQLLTRCIDLAHVFQLMEEEVLPQHARHIDDYFVFLGCLQDILQLSKAMETTAAQHSMLHGTRPLHHQFLAPTP